MEDILRIRTPEKWGKGDREVYRSIADNSLHFFTVFVAGYDRLTLPDGFHGGLCRRLSHIGKPMLELDWRGAFKTTVAAIARPLWGACKDPKRYDHIHIVDDLPLGKQHLKVIGGHIYPPTEENKVLRALYPEVQPDKSQWSLTSKSLAGRVLQKEGPTFEVRSTGQSLAGRHRAAITMDDLVNEQNYQSRMLQDELKDKFKYMWPTLDTDDLVMIGTLYAGYDLWGYIIQELWPEIIDVFVQPVRGTAKIVADQHRKRIVGDDTGVYAHPAEWDDDRYERTRRQVKDPYVFACQYMLSTEQERGIGIKSQWIQYFEGEELPLMSTFIGVDSASGKGTSRPAIAVCGITEAGDFYALHSDSDFETEAELIEAVFLAHTKYSPIIVAVERYGQGGYGTILQIENLMRRKRQYMPIEPVTGHAQGKIPFIREALRPLYKMGMMYHLPAFRGSEYEAELNAFPGGQYLDELDAMAHAVSQALKFGFQESGDRPKREMPKVKNGDKIGYTLEQLTRPVPFEEDSSRKAKVW